MPQQQSNPPPQTQKQRWVRYGVNVAVACIVVIVLVGLLTYGAQNLTRRFGLRSDTTAGSVHSLKPQSLNILKDLHQKIRLVGLYPNPTQKYQQQNSPEAQKYYRFVSDLLQEYAQAGNQVTAEMIDPVAEPSKVDQLITQVSQEYGKGAKPYQDALGEFSGLVDQIKAFAADQSKQLADLPLKGLKDGDLSQTMQLAAATVEGFPDLLRQSADQISDDLKQKLPDYQGLSSQVQQNLDQLSRMLARVAEDFTKIKDQADAPQAIRKYAATAAPAFAGINKKVEDYSKKLKGLGQLKQLDTFRENLKSRSILVLGEHDMRIIPFDQVWTAPKNISGMDVEQVGRSLRFAGEQQVSTAIAALEQKTPTKVVFIRPGGPPLTSAGSLFEEAGPLSDIAAQLKQYNFDVMEKDISGQWAMQAQMQRRPVAPEPSDADIKDAIWVVLSFAPKMGRQGPNPLGPKLEEHLKQGGSALVLFFPMADNLSDALKPYGVTARTDLVAMHEAISSRGSSTSDMLENAQRMPVVFVTRNYGDHPLAKPLASLASLLSPIIPVQVSQEAKYDVTPLIPIPRTPMSWGESDVNDALQNKPVEYKPAQGAEGGDLPNTQADPLYAGAAVQAKDGKGGRLVVLGSLQFAMNQILEIPDQEMLKRGVVAAQFPGNAELFENSIFWLARMKSMLAISPEALQISRIVPMSDGQLAWWRWGVLIVIIPLAVVLCGAGVYLKRRD